MSRIIIGISGASGVIIGYRLTEAFKLYTNYQIHLIVTENATKNFFLETDINLNNLYKLADCVNENNNMSALVSSGSFITSGMVIAPCSMKTLSAISNGFTSELLVRAADVCLKENRKVVLVPREMPLGRIHLKNMLSASKLGCTIIPPMLTFYNHPDSLEDQINHIIGKIFMQFGLNYKNFHGWQGNVEN